MSANEKGELELLTDSHPGSPCILCLPANWRGGVRATYVAARDESQKGLAIRVQFLLYLAISSIAAMVNLLVGFSLYALLGLSAGSLYALSVAIGYLAGMVVNWSLNRVFTFPGSGRRKLSELRTFVVVALIGLLLTVALAAGFRSTLAPYIAELVARAGSVTRSIG